MQVQGTLTERSMYHVFKFININIPTPIKTTLCTTQDYTSGFVSIFISRQSKKALKKLGEKHDVFHALWGLCRCKKGKMGYMDTFFGTSESDRLESIY